MKVMNPQSLINWSEMNMQNVFEQDHRTQKLTTDSKINKWYKFDLCSENANTIYRDQELFCYESKSSWNTCG